MFVDRIPCPPGAASTLRHKFEVKDNRLVPDAIAELAIIDSLRASVGLPPMVEYVKLRKSIYRLPVQRPPVASTRR